MKKAILVSIIMLALIVASAGCIQQLSQLISGNQNSAENSNAEAKVTCPSSCDDKNSCTEDSCSESTQFACVHTKIPKCCGNGECEKSYGENRDTCEIDCVKHCKTALECDDSKNNTIDQCISESCSNVLSPELTYVTPYVQPNISDERDAN